MKEYVIPKESYNDFCRHLASRVGEDIAGLCSYPLTRSKESKIEVKFKTGEKASIQEYWGDRVKVVIEEEGTKLSELLEKYLLTNQFIL